MPSNAPSSSDDFAAALAEAAKGVIPANRPVESVVAKLRANRKALLEMKAEGFSPAQIVTFLKHPRINIDVSVVTLRKVMGGAHRKKAAKAAYAPTKYTAALPANPPPAPSK